MNFLVYLLRLFLKIILLQKRYSFRRCLAKLILLSGQLSNLLVCKLNQLLCTLHLLLFFVEINFSGHFIKTLCHIKHALLNLLNKSLLLGSFFFKKHHLLIKFTFEDFLLFIQLYFKSLPLENFRLKLF